MNKKYLFYTAFQVLGLGIGCLMQGVELHLFFRFSAWIFISNILVLGKLDKYEEGE